MSVIGLQVRIKKNTYAFIEKHISQQDVQSEYSFNEELSVCNRYFSNVETSENYLFIDIIERKFCKLNFETNKWITKQYFSIIK